MGGTVPHIPRRGSDVERWLQGWRDTWPGGYPGHAVAHDAINEMIRDYRARADAGALLDQEVEDGGDATWYEVG